MNTVQPVTTDVETHVDATPAQISRFEVVARLADMAAVLGVDFPSVDFNGSSGFRLHVDSLAELEAWMRVFDLKPEPDGSYWAHRHPTIPALMYQTAADYKQWNGWYLGIFSCSEQIVTSGGAL